MLSKPLEDASRSLRAASAGPDSTNAWHVKVFGPRVPPTGVPIRFCELWFLRLPCFLNYRLSYQRKACCGSTLWQHDWWCGSRQLSHWNVRQTYLQMTCTKSRLEYKLINYSRCITVELLPESRYVTINKLCSFLAKHSEIAKYKPTLTPSS